MLTRKHAKGKVTIDVTFPKAVRRQPENTRTVAFSDERAIASRDQAKPRKHSKRDVSATSAKRGGFKVKIRNVGGYATMILPEGTDKFARDATRSDEDYQIGRLKHSYDLIERRLIKAAKANDTLKVATLAALLTNTRARMQFIVDKRTARLTGSARDGT